MRIDYEQVSRVAPLAKRLVEEYSRKGVDSFTDERYYPPPSHSREDVARYFLVMVAMDHRLSRPGKPYEALVDGERYHGADLLYRLGMKKYTEDPGFFEPERLAEIRVRDVLEWLCVGEVCPPDPERRASLLRDLGVKLVKLYGSSAYQLLEASKGRLRGAPEEPGLLDLLKTFMAYNDPVEKKAFLLAKFVERRGLLAVRDAENKRVPVDNHVTRIALRLGIVRVEGPVLEKYSRGIAFNEYEDVLLRVLVREAWHSIASIAGIDDFILDDLLWAGGRKNCVREEPLCNKCSRGPFCLEGRCAFSQVCPVGLGAWKPLDEHLFLDTWWY